MTLLNWLLALVSLLLWGGSIVWYFRRDVKRMWQTRNDKWFRTD